MKIEFFIPMKIPTVTQQEHKVAVVNGKPRFYEPAELKAARQKFFDAVCQHRPDAPIEGPVRLITKWIWEGEKGTYYKITKPDTDNLIKMLKDEMTKAGFWKDDAQVASEVTEKFISDGFPGIYIRVTQLEEADHDD